MIRDKLEHLAAMLPLFLCIWFAYPYGPLPTTATAITIAGFMIEVREGEAFKWYSGKRGTFGLKATFFGIKRALGLRPENHGRDSLYDWLIPSVAAWAAALFF